MNNPPASPLASLHILTWTALCAALIAAGAMCRLSFGPIPFTLQSTFVIFAGLALGPLRGAVAVALYLMAGAIGLPVYAGGTGGMAYLFGPSGGYLLGFLFLACMAGCGSRLWQKHTRIAPTQPSSFALSPAGQPPAVPPPSGQALHQQGSPPQGTLANSTRSTSLLRLVMIFPCIIAGMVGLYAAGASWLAHRLEFSATKAFAVGVLPFLPGDAVQALAAVLLWRMLLRQGLLPPTVA